MNCSTNLLNCVILFMEHAKAVGTLDCPCWFSAASAPFKTRLFSDGCNPIRAIVDIYEVPQCEDMFLQGRKVTKSSLRIPQGATF